LDLILLPGDYTVMLFWIETDVLQGVAFDRSLSRLGHGKGYYDRFISSYVASGRARPLLGVSSGCAFLVCPSILKSIILFPTVALALREQVLDAGHVPMGEHDWKMDMIITPDEIIGSFKKDG
jgi:5-formyltetrahydrofolate cyclo-ligase